MTYARRPSQDELRPEYRPWMVLRGATPTTKASRCHQCGRIMNGLSSDDWFLKQGLQRAHVKCARIGYQDAGADTTITRIEAEPAETRYKLWELSDPALSADPWATVGYGQEIEAGRRGVRLEIAEALSAGFHKGRAIPANKLEPAAARQLGQALIEAANQADNGQTPATKRSNE